MATLTGNPTDPIHSEIIFNFRMPKAIAAILAGAALSVAGLLMQTLFRNPLADPYILGVSSGASLGVAITMMSASFLPAFWTNSSWGLVLSAVFGAAFVLLVIGVSYKLQSCFTANCGYRLGPLPAPSSAFCSTFPIPTPSNYLYYGHLEA